MRTGPVDEGGLTLDVGADGIYLERLVCHDRFPLIAGLEAGRPRVHVWEYGTGGLQEVGSVDAAAEAYPPEPWERHRLVPSLAWHPDEPSLVVTGPMRTVSWPPDDVAVLRPAGSEGGYRYVAFSPDGRALWGSPSAVLDGDEAWRRSDVLDLATGQVTLRQGWDTGVVAFPAEVW